MYRSLSAAFALATLAPLLLGCAALPAGYGGAAEAPGPFATSRPPPVSRHELTVVFSPAARVELDFRRSIMASEAQLFTAIYEGLFSMHPVTMAPVPALAQSWDLSDDGREWTFTIRADARFCNGEAITAHDFKRAWLSLLSPDRNAPYSSMFDLIEGARAYRTGAGTSAGVGIAAVDARTFTVRLNSPAAFFPSMLCHHAFSPIHRSMVDVEDWSLSPPVSSGPFRISEMDGQRIVLVRNRYYWDADGLALDRIVIRFADDEKAGELWNSGEALWIAGNVNIASLTDRSGISVHPLFGTHFYFIRWQERPLDDYRVRQALSLALPWDEIRGRHFLPARTLVNPLPGYPRIYGVGDTDAAAAATLLAQAGFPGGYGMPELVFRITPSAEAARITGLMADAWRELGIASRFEVVAFDDYFDSLHLDGYHVGSSTWIGDFPDPYSFLKKWRRDSNLNNALHSDDDFEALMDRSMLEEGPTRWATLAEAEQLLLDRGTVLPVSFVPAINIIDTNELTGWFPNALGIHPFRYLAFRDLRPLPGVVMLYGAPR